jgi:hypothetical protein
MSKEKITYILGAGASIGAFPLVKGTEEWEGRGLADDLIHQADKLEYLALNPINNHVTTALREIGAWSNEFGNLDSYAKYLYHTKQFDKLGRLKLALTYYFLSNQLSIDGCASKEKRYLNFITSIIDEKDQFPENVKVLSWNYDFLFENATSVYNDNERFIQGDKVSQHTPGFVSYFPNYGYSFQLTHKDYGNKDFSIVHLNGIAGFYLDQEDELSEVFTSVFNDFKKNGIVDKIGENDFMDFFEEKYSKKQHLLTFAWEKKSKTKASLINSYEIAQEIIKDTTILVVIGYSFPIYNREVDNMIFKEITPSLKKIYYQDPFIDGEFLRNRYNLPPQVLEREEIEKYEKAVTRSNSTIPQLPPPPYPKTLKIEQIINTDQFYIPVEL